MTAPTAPNVNTLWGRVVVDELAKAGVERVCVVPGSRSTPLAVAAARNDDLVVDSLLDERSAGFYALGRAKRTGRPTPLVCTSGTAAAEFHPAVIEADRSRTPMVVLTADRPPSLQDSGANQTVDQLRLYGDAVRWFRALPEPAVDDRTLRSLRTTVARAVLASLGPNPGPVHLDVPFEKPLAPVVGPDPVPAAFADRFPLAVHGRDGPYVRAHRGTLTTAPETIDAVADAVVAAERGLIVAGPRGVDGLAPEAAAALAEATGYPLLADVLSGLRFDPALAGVDVVGGYDAYLGTDAVSGWPHPEVVVRFGASPTSQSLQTYLGDAGARQFVVDAAGGWREATFAATDLVVADPTAFAAALAERLRERGAGDEDTGAADWAGRFRAAEAAHWSLVGATDVLFEGALAGRTAALAPTSATLFVSNSMPVRDLDRFAEPSAAGLTVLGNRGASGIDGITSTALGAGSATDDPLVLLTGDLACYHDLTGLLALERGGVEATIVLVNNDGGGIFNMLPIAAVDPPFTELFETPHGLDFGHVADLFGLTHVVVDALDGFESAYRDALTADGSHLVEVTTDARDSFAVRDRLQADLVGRLG